MELMPTDLGVYIEGRLKHMLSTSRLKSREDVMPFPLPVAIDIMHQIAKAVLYLHDRHLSHRDLKPSNILVKKQEKVGVASIDGAGYLDIKLADFGLAKAYNNTSTAQAHTANTGTPFYGAPEIFGKDLTLERNVFPMADVWAFGMTCAEILSGKKPYADKPRMTIQNLQRRICKGGLRPTLPKHCPQYLAFCIRCCWELLPERRPDFASICNMLRHAKLLSLGVTNLDDSKLFIAYKTRSGHVKCLSKAKASTGERFSKFFDTSLECLGLNHLCPEGEFLSPTLASLRSQEVESLSSFFIAEPATPPIAINQASISSTSMSVPEIVAAEPATLEIAAAEPTTPPIAMDQASISSASMSVQEIVAAESATPPSLTSTTITTITSSNPLLHRITSTRACSLGEMVPSRIAMAYQNFILASIDQVELLVTGGTLELNRTQCQVLSYELQNVTAEFLQREDVTHRFLRSSRSSGCRWRAALLQLYFVVKQAENLVQQCCESEASTWPKRALTLFAVGDYVVDILAHLRWWTSILSMLIDNPSSKLSKLERVKLANQEFEQNLKGSSDLQTAALKDREHLLNKVLDKILNKALAKTQAYPNHGKPDDDYLLLLQVHALLIDKEDYSTPQLHEYQYDGKNALVEHSAFGVVHRVRWCGYDCVLKQSDIDSLKPDNIEVKSLKRFHHPHIVRFFRHWKNENTEKSNILMERMEKDLCEHIKSQAQRKLRQTWPFSLPVAIDIMLQVVNAMWYIHNKGVIHRDLKPYNVMVQENGENVVHELSAEGYVHVKLGGFHIAKENMLTSSVGALTFKAGTTLYRAPELASKEYIRLGTRKFPHKADMWSFGILCSEILTGQQPFKEILRISALQAYVEEGGRPSLPDDCPDYLRFCIEKCWEREPEDRPRSSDMWKMLRVVQLRSLGLIDENYDLFTFNDHSDQLVMQL